MRPIRQILVAAFLTIALFTVVAYTACKKDACENVICLNLGTCDGGKCICPTGYEGARCEILSRNKFIFTFNGSDSCNRSSKSVGSYPVYFRAILDNPLELIMKNFLNNFDDSAVCTIQRIDSLTFIGSNNSTTYYGQVKISHDSLWMSYHVDSDTSSYDCKYFGQGLR